MTQLLNFPNENQLKAGVNRNDDCVPTLIADGVEYFTHKHFDIETVLDAVYGKGYRGLTSPGAFVGFCRSHGVRLWKVDELTGTALVASVRLNIQAGHPVIGTEKNPYGNPNVTHVIAFYKEEKGLIWAHDPFGAKIIEHTDSEWAGILLNHEIWVMSLITQPAKPPAKKPDLTPPYNGGKTAVAGTNANPTPVGPAVPPPVSPVIVQGGGTQVATSAPVSLCTQISARTGHVVMFVGNECLYWTPQQFGLAARNAKALGCDALCAKRLNGMQKWYGTPQRLAQEAAAIEAEGVIPMGMGYLYGPIFGEDQIRAECAGMAEMAPAYSGLMVVDMEREWNNKSSDAKLFAECMSQEKDMLRSRGVHPLLIVSTWADPYQQSWQDVFRAIESVTDVFGPQQYTNWLAAQETQLVALGGKCIQPEVSLNYPHAINDYGAIIELAHTHGHSTVWLWEYGSMIGREGNIKVIAHLMKEGTVTLLTD